MPERIPRLVDEMAALRAEIETRHEENERRFDRIEKAAAVVTGEVRIIIALLVANGGLNLAALFEHHH